MIPIIKKVFSKLCHKTNTRKMKGSITPLAIIVIFVILALALPFTAIVLIELNISANQGKRVQAFYLADAGLEYGNDQLRQTNGTWTGTGTTPVYLTHANGTIGSFLINVTTSVSNGVTFWTLTSIGTPSDTYSSASIVGITRQANYANFLIFRETMNARFGDGYYANGRVHVNDDLKTDNSPVFEKLVTAVGKHDHTGSKQAKFRGGLQTYASYIAMPTTYDIDGLYTKANSTGLTDQQYTGSTVYSATTVTFNGATATVVITKTGATTKIINYPLSGESLMAFRTPVYVSGTVDGRVTIVSMDDITITSNLVYKDRTSSSDDMTGLISKGIVEIAQNCPTTLNVDASILVPLSGGCFQAGPALNVAKNTLNFNGSYTSYENGSFVSGSKGFQTRNFLYDNRLINSCPPYFFYIDNIFHMIYWKNAYFL
ncbi:MAG: hypothetical protein ACE14V_00985 [bacterium]